MAQYVINRDFGDERTVTADKVSNDEYFVNFTMDGTLVLKMQRERVLTVERQDTDAQ